MKADALFLSKVFLTLISQLLVTFFVVYYLSSRLSHYNYNRVFFLIAFIVSFFLIFGIMSSELTRFEKMVLFTFFSILFGYMLSPIGLVNKKIILSALAGTIGIFIFMFIGGYLFTHYKINLDSLGKILFGSLIGLIVAGLVDLMFGLSKTAYRFYIYAGLIVYSLFVVFDTQVILQKKYGDDYVASSFSYYLDFLGIFLRLVQFKK